MARAERVATAPPTVLRIAVACSPAPGRAQETMLSLRAPATALDALRASGVFERHPELALGELSIGIWGRACTAETLLAEGDRVELYRPLAQGPNEARRRRARELKKARR
jgi:putative ubiquitin-RnfH superfamily antitoxin RatB of RatAB toxin-antitoxin module